jgi:hypothetical protein
MKDTMIRLHDKALIGLIIAVSMDKAQHITYRDNCGCEFEDKVKLMVKHEMSHALIKYDQ